ncbi:MAG TPA: glutamine-hydrolyzing GMP synthase [Phycisphaerae bacterium]|nr:glutamine-hydrolyzing GMP synthase [Phycisphaerae bacterium]
MNQSTANNQQTIPVLDFGAQYVQLIARRVREAGVHAVLVAPDISIAKLKALNPIGLILSGGPASVYEAGAPRCDPGIFELNIPVLGICYGMQIAAELLGGKVKPGNAGEYGSTRLTVRRDGPEARLAEDLFSGVPDQTQVWMSHGDQVQDLGPEFVPLASTPTCPLAAMRHKSRPFFGVQFHPEVTHTPHGEKILENFLYRVCNASGTWKMGNFLETAVEKIHRQVGAGKVICGLSGGVDSSVAAALIHKAIGDQLVCIFVDNGLLRKNERQNVESTFRDHFHIDLRVVDASEEFLAALQGVAEPQQKRTIIGKAFIDVFKTAARLIPGAHFLAQGTLYPDVIESGHGLARTAANIKLHHNVGGLPENLGFELVEPLRDLFKDEVRRLGEVLGLPEHIVWRHPFPGPGLAVRCLGPVTQEGLDTLRHADEILLEEIVAAGLYRRTAQTFAVLLPVSSVAVMGDGRGYKPVIALRSVDSTDFMTADWSRIPYDVLARISSRIVNEVRNVSRVVYDVTSKPPGTIEWE